MKRISARSFAGVMVFVSDGSVIHNLKGLFVVRTLETPEQMQERLTNTILSNLKDKYPATFEDTMCFFTKFEQLDITDIYIDRYKEK